jgi:uncharacterized phage infection (PIP) family protein YhgE
MNTEKLNTYKKIVEALKEVNDMRNRHNAGKPERLELDRAALLLEELSWKVISDDITRLTGSISDKANELKELSKRIKKQYNKLKNISDTIRKAADVAATLAEIIAKAVAAGLI